MAYRCIIGNHGKCTACEKPINPSLPDHCHLYKGRGHGTDLICDDCWIITCVAANIVLQATKDAGLQFADVDSTVAYIQHYVTVGCQLPLGIWPTPQN